jgi:hypothetical protein
MVVDFGDELRSAYIYLEADSTVYKSVTLKWKVGEKSGSIEDGKYPFEWTLPLEARDESVEFSVSAVKLDGTTEQSETARLGR